MNVEHVGPAICKLNNSHIFVCGGQNNKAAQRFNVQEKLWESLPDMNEPRSEAGAVAVNGSLYVFCGFNIAEDTPLSSVEKMVNAGGPQ